MGQHIIDLGPGAGHEGGRVVFEGTPAELVAAKKTLTVSTWRHSSAAVRGLSPAPIATRTAIEAARAGDVDRLEGRQ